jgi:hypothetical protein
MPSEKNCGRKEDKQRKVNRRADRKRALQASDSLGEIPIMIRIKSEYVRNDEISPAENPMYEGPV